MDLQAFDAGWAGNRPIDLRDRAIVAILVTTAGRNSAVRLLRLDDVDAERWLLRFWRGKGGKSSPSPPIVMGRPLAASDSLRHGA